MTIAQIIRNGKGQAHAWVVTIDPTIGITSHKLWHYGTLMLEWVDGTEDTKEYQYCAILTPELTFGADDNPKVILDWSLGKGSASDQNGMNVAFKILGIPWRYDRFGGAPRIVNYLTNTVIAR